MRAARAPQLIVLKAWRPCRNSCHSLVTGVIVRVSPVSLFLHHVREMRFALEFSSRPFNLQKGNLHARDPARIGVWDKS